MKIVNRETFLAMPPQTVFCKYQHCTMDALMIKGETWDNDFLYQDIAESIDAKDSGEFAGMLFASAESGSSVRFDFNCQGRDGLFDKDQLFAVWERQDVEQLIARLRATLTVPVSQ